MAVKRQRRKRPPTPEGVSHTARGAVVVKFPEDPGDEIRRRLSLAGFRFNRKRCAWVHKSTRDNEDLASRMLNAYQASVCDDE